MLAYGYPFHSDAETPEALIEASLICTREELDSVISFLQKIRDEYRDYDEVAGIHRHYRDFRNTWDETQSDFILCLSDQIQKRKMQ